MEIGKSPMQVTIKWADIGRAALGAVWDAVYKYTTPNPNGYRGEHFIHENPEKLGYAALRESDDGIPSFHEVDTLQADFDGTSK